ncbi:MAG: hypothetical protein WKG07_41520 [Hymenobacter sp.]
MNDVKNLAQQHEAGFAGLRHLYPRDLLWKGILWPAIISSLLTGIFLLAQIEPLKIVFSIVESIIAVMPSLLGFLLGGYTILISFSNSKLLKSLTEIPANDKISVFQKVSCIFALTILVQSATLLLALITRFSMLVVVPVPSAYVWMLTMFKVINYSFGFLLMLMFLYTIIAFQRHNS